MAASCTAGCWSSALISASGNSTLADASWAEPTSTARVTSGLLRSSGLVIPEPSPTRTTLLSMNSGSLANITCWARVGRFVAAMPEKSKRPAASAANSSANGTSTNSTSAPRSSIIRRARSTE